MACFDEEFEEELSVKSIMYKCPVCGHRTLPGRGEFDICEECGWEDEGVYDEDKESPFGANGDYTIRKYREEYLEKKAADPDYTWSGQFDDEEDSID